MMQVMLGTSWRAMVPELAAQLRAHLDSPFSRAHVLVDSPGSARLLSQELAAVDGISAGVEFLTIGRWLGVLAEQAGVADEWEAWRSPRLATALAEEFDAVAPEHPLLGAHLAKPGRRLSTAARLAPLFRNYADHAPGLVRSWIDGEPEDLPEHLAWQPDLLRAACERLALDPVDLTESLADAAQELTHVWLFSVDDVPAALRPIVAAASPIAAWFVADLPEWLSAVPHEEPTRTGKPLRALPKVEIHGSHSTSRQAEVLRDELTRAFEEDPTLEARDVLIVCPAPEVWAPVLNSVFRATSLHPGRELRVAEVTTDRGGNHAVDALLMALDLIDDRATATQVVEFLLHPAIAGRWGFEAKRDDLVTLVSEAQIRWGLDASQRARHGLDGAHNTWISGIDAMLTGLTMGDAIGPRGVTGVAATTSSDVDLIGSLAEVVGRLWQLGDATKQPLTVPRWCEVAAEAIANLVGLDFDDRWMERQAAGLLARLTAAHEDATITLDRAEFRRLLIAGLPSRWHRPALGNGGLHIVGPREVRHVDTKLTAFIGLGDGAPGPLPDEVPGVLPDQRSAHHRALLAHAKSAHRVLIVTHTRSERTGAEQEMPVAIRFLLRQLEQPLPEIVHHSPQPSNASAFIGRGSFDAAAFEGASRVGTSAPAPQSLRRREALDLPVEPPPQELRLGELRTFLVDPIKQFLRHRLDVHWYDEPQLEDQAPLALVGLDHWRLTAEFIRGRLQHEEPSTLLRRAASSQILPPGDLGRGFAVDIGRTSDMVVEMAHRMMSDPARTVDIALDLGSTRLVGTVTLHGSRVVVPEASSGTKGLLTPWLELLALAASGVRATAHVIRPKRGARPRTNELRQPTPDQARDLLALYAQAWAHGRSRLLPAPFEPAFQLAMEQRHRRFDADEWLKPKPGAWSKWRFPDPLWHLFYEDPTSQFLADAAADGDPGTAFSGFERWAIALYRPLTEQGGSW